MKRPRDPEMFAGVLAVLLIVGTLTLACALLIGGKV